MESMHNQQFLYTCQVLHKEHMIKFGRQGETSCLMAESEVIYAYGLYEDAWLLLCAWLCNLHAKPVAVLAMLCHT